MDIKKGRVTVYFIETTLEKIRDAQGFACRGSMVNASSAEGGRHDKYPKS
jgi:hypothetical protein